MDDIPIGPASAKPNPFAKGKTPGTPGTAGGSSSPKGHGPAGGAEEPRRNFMAEASAVVIGGAITVCPVAAGLAVMSDPLMRKAAAVDFVKIASLAALPDDGVPRQFPVIVDKRDDAWTRYVNEPIGSVFLKRAPGSDKVEAWNATCTHAGCFVTFLNEKKEYFCPCHNSAFDIQGKVVSGPPPRELDSLECQVVDGVIQVKFQDFYVGIHDKMPKV